VKRKVPAGLRPLVGVGGRTATRRGRRSYSLGEMVKIRQGAGSDLEFRASSANSDRGTNVVGGGPAMSG
jgi:hypothetical protein